MKPFRATTEQPPTGAHHTHRQTPLDFTALWMRVVVALLVIVACVWALSWRVPSWATDGRNAVAGVVLVVALIYAGVLALYAYLQHLEAYGRREPKAQRTGDTWRIHLKRELPVGNRGAVEMEPDPVDLPVKPAEFVRIVRDMQRSGTSRDKRPAGVSQPLWRRVMTALEDLDGAVNGPNGFEFTDDLDALLEDISRW